MYVKLISEPVLRNWRGEVAESEEKCLQVSGGKLKERDCLK
jgi:hypothetical protein